MITVADLEFAQGKFAEGTQLLEQLIATEKSPDHVLTAQIKLAEVHLNRERPVLDRLACKNEE